MKFTYRNNTYVIDRYWQVLGTPEHSIPNERIAEWGRYVFHFSRDKEDVCDWSDKHLAELVSQIESNNDKGEFWRYIPLVREFIHEFKDETRGMGFCFGYWSAKRAALEKRGIQWRSPASMNSRVMFD